MDSYLRVDGHKPRYVEKHPNFDTLLFLFRVKDKIP